jgi:hypothetical protein
MRRERADREPGRRVLPLIAGMSPGPCIFKKLGRIIAVEFTWMRFIEIVFDIGQPEFDAVALGRGIDAVQIADSVVQRFLTVLLTLV